MMTLSPSTSETLSLGYCQVIKRRDQEDLAFPQSNAPPFGSSRGPTQTASMTSVHLLTL